MPGLTPLRFQPLFRRYLWGGRRLHSLLHKPIGPEPDYAESWEVVDHGDDQSVVVAGPAAGLTLGELLARQGAEILGRHWQAVPYATSSGSCGSRPQFPLLMKFLDANQNLSVQVHPNDEQAAQRLPPDLGKTEAWVILHADPGARIYAGLKRGFDRAALAREVARGTTELCLHAFEPEPGDCVFIPAGTVHALGAGLVVAEIQQSSDTTFRLYDWNRRGPDGQPRQLHIQEALDVIDFDAGPVQPIRAASGPNSGCQRLVECPKFVLERRSLVTRSSIGGDDRFHLVVVLNGQLSIEHDPLDKPLTCGETVLIPASLGPLAIEPHSPVSLLDIYLPS